jgi:hypothetical protein
VPQADLKDKGTSDAVSIPRCRYRQTRTTTATKIPTHIFVLLDGRELGEKKVYFLDFVLLLLIFLLKKRMPKLRNLLIQL